MNFKGINMSKININEMKKSKTFLAFFISYMIILLIYIIIGVLSYYKVAQVVKEQNIKYNMAMLNQVRNIIDEKLSVINNLTLDISNDKEIKNLCTLDVNSYEYNEEVKKIVNNIYDYKNRSDFIYDMFIYLKDSDDIISSKGKFKSEFFFNNIYKFNTRDYLDWKSKFLLDESIRGYLPQEGINTGKFDEKVVAYIKPLKWKTITHIGNLVVLVNEEKVTDIIKDLQQVNKGDIYIVNSENELIAADNNSSIISENYGKDIPYELLKGREGAVENTFQSDKVIYTYTTSFINEWRYICITPFKAFMKKVDDIKVFLLYVVIISGILGVFLALFLSYRNYNPLRKLMLFLKIETLSAENDYSTYESEYEYIKGIVESTVKERENIKFIMEKQKPVFVSNILLRLMRGRMGDKNNFNDTLNFWKVDFISDIFLVQIINVDSLINRKGETEEYKNWAFSQFAINNIIISLLEDIGKAFIVEIDADKIGVVINIQNEYKDNMDVVLSNTLNIKEKLESSFPICCTIGVSNIHHGMKNISEAYSESITALNYKIVRGNGSIIAYEGIVESEEDYYYPIELEMQLLNFIKAGDFKRIDEMLHKIFQENFEKRKLPLRLVRCLFYDIMSTALKGLNQIKVDYKDVFEGGSDPASELSYCQTLDDMFDTIRFIYKKICHYIGNNRKSHNVKLKENITIYIKDNYNNCDLNVNTIASEYNLNPSYLSSFFKEQTNYNLVDYINCIRLENAKRLLKEEKLSINEIAVMVGYGNSHRFIRVFKKIVGLTPGDYREKTNL